MVNERSVNLINLLKTKTIDRSIKWDCTRDDNEFKTHFNGASISIRQDWNHDEEETYEVMCIYNDDGKIIDQIYSNFHKLFATLLTDLYQAARGNALKAEETYDRLLEILSKDKIEQPDSNNTGDTDIPF